MKIRTPCLPTAKPAWPWLKQTSHHALRFPYGTQPALAVCARLYFTPGLYQPDIQRSPEWNRGAYLVRGLGHCGAPAPQPRANALGASSKCAWTWPAG